MPTKKQPSVWQTNLRKYKIHTFNTRFVILRFGGYDTEQDALNVDVRATSAKDACKKAKKLTGRSHAEAIEVESDE